MINKKNSLKVLLTAVDDYPNPKHKLKGCVNDLEAVAEYLKEWHDTDKVKLDLLVLKDQDATRENVVNAFATHFGSMMPGDIALFYFSGHGYSGAAPEEYWHFTPNKRYETLVCFDSRTPQGRDLADKELSFLIYKVMKQESVHFTAILDCCHSGSALRDTLGHEDEPFEKYEEENLNNDYKNEYAQIREIKSAGKQNKKIAFLGHEDHVHHNGKTTIPHGRHILLSSCRDYEKAREINFNGKRRGVFTYCLLQALKKSNGKLTYNQLMAKTRAQTAYYNQNQHPQLVVTDAEDANGIFLSQCIIEKPKWSLVHFHPTLGWRIDFGMMQGLMPGIDNFMDGSLLLYDDRTPDNELKTKSSSVCKATITGVYSNYSTLRLSEDLDETKQFKAIFLKLPVPKLKVGLILEDSDLNTAMAIKVNNDRKFQYFSLVEDVEQASHVIKYEEGQLVFSQKEENRQLYSTSETGGEKAMTLLLEYIEIYSRWNMIKGISSPLDSFDPADIQLQFNVVTKATPDNLEVLEEHTISDFLRKDLVLNYKLKENQSGSANQWEEPMFRLKIKNTSGKKRFWCSLLYLGSDFSISNELMPSISLGPGEECWAESDDPDYSCKTSLIPMHIEDEYLENNIYKIKEHFKIIISTEQFDTHSYNQNGIPLGVKSKDKFRSLNRKSRGINGDFVQWAVFDFAIKVVLPQKQIKK